MTENLAVDFVSGLVIGAYEVMGKLFHPISQPSWSLLVNREGENQGVYPWVQVTRAAVQCRRGRALQGPLGGGGR